MSFKALDSEKRRVVANIVQYLDIAVTSLASGKLRRRGVRLKASPPRPPTRLAKYCQRQNRKACEEALRWIGLFFREADIEEAIKWGVANNIMPEVVIAYLYAFIKRLMGSDNNPSIEKVRVDMEHFALDLTPVGSEFTITDARNVLPSLRLPGV